MNITAQVRDQTARITMSGRFVFGIHRDFTDAYMPLIDNGAVREIEIDMSNVNYMDSAALGMLLLLHERAVVAKKTLTLNNVSSVVSQFLDVANFSRLFSITKAS